jgi:hypothetical protein
MSQNVKIVIGVLVLIIVGVGIFAFTNRPEPEVIPEPEVEVVVEEAPFSSMNVIGSSVNGRDIETHTYGSGENHLLFVGGVHGGYEWNSTLLAYEFMDYLEANPENVPEDITVSIIPSLNPDGLYTVIEKEGRFTLADVPDPGTRTAEGRFNANNVDLNRNFDCKWAPESSWRGNVVSAGDEAFSEPEAQALRDFVSEQNPKAVMFWHSQANNVYASECENGVLPETLTLMSTYAKAAGYGEVPVFDAYPITGDAEGWLASINIPAVTVELKGFQTTEWSQNLEGSKAVIDLYSTVAK